MNYAQDIPIKWQKMQPQIKVERSSMCTRLIMHSNVMNVLASLTCRLQQSFEFWTGWPSKECPSSNVPLITYISRIRFPYQLAQLRRPLLDSSLLNIFTVGVLTVLAPELSYKC